MGQPAPGNLEKHLRQNASAYEHRPREVMMGRNNGKTNPLLLLLVRPIFHSMAVNSVRGQAYTTKTHLDSKLRSDALDAVLEVDG